MTNIERVQEHYPTAGKSWESKTVIGMYCIREEFLFNKERKKERERQTDRKPWEYLVEVKVTVGGIQTETTESSFITNRFYILLSM